MVSLFTFMDSLVCTMGALILLMLWITHSTGKLKKFEKPKPTVTTTIETTTPTKTVVAKTAPAAAAITSPPVAVVKPARIIAPKREFVPPAFDEAIPSQIDGTNAATDAELAAERDRLKQIWSERVAMAESERDQHLLQIRSERKLKAAAEARSRQTEAEILLTREQLATLESQREELLKSKATSQSELDKLLQKIANTRRNLDLLKKQQAHAKSEYAIVPYDGTSGTRRRPIYIECTDRGFHILPEDVWIRVGDLKGFSERLNPLVIGVTTLNDYWTQRAQAGDSQGREAERPYVLLIVRPTGTMAYYVGRKLLGKFRGDSGYELVEEDWKLSVPPADPIAKTILQRSLEQAYAIRDQQNREERESEDSSTGELASPGSTSRRSRSFVADSVGTIVQDRPGGALRYHATPDSLSEISRRAREIAGPREIAGTRGGLTAGSRIATGLAQSPNGDGQEAPQLLPPLPTGDEKATGPGGIAQEPELASDTKHRTPSGPPLLNRGNGSGGTSEVSDGSPSPLITNRMGHRRSSRSFSTAPVAASDDPTGAISDLGQDLPEPWAVNAVERSASPGIANRGDTRLATRAQLPEGVPEPLIASTFSSGSAGVRAGTNSVNNETGSEGLGESSDAMEGVGAPTAGSRSVTEPAGRSVRTGLMPPEDSTTQGDGVVQESSPGAASLNLSAGSAPAGGSSAGTGAGRKSRPPAGPDGVELHSRDTKGRASLQPEDSEETFTTMSARKSAEGESSDSPPGKVQFNFGGNDQGPRSARGSRGKLWTNLRGRRGIGLEKRVEIHVLEDRLLVGPDDATVMAGRGESRNELVQRVLFGIEAVSESWGVPPNNFYHVPKVHFKIYPGGSQHYERVHPTLRLHGVESTAEYALDGAPGKSSQGEQP